MSKAFRQLRYGDLLSQDPKDKAGSIEGSLDLIRYQAGVAQKYGLPLVAYEGGQHLTAEIGLENDEELIKFFIALNRHPNMYKLYTDLLNGWKQSGGTIFMHYVDIAAPSKWGTWGALEYANQKSSPKYQALIDFNNQQRKSR
jgi:hypothetical protein